MSYSICNVLKETGLENIMRWLPFKIDRGIILDRLRNKMIRPTTIPQTLEQLVIEHAVAREALRLGLQHHRLIARPLLGGKRELTMEERMGPLDRTQTYIDMRNVNYIGGTGGLLSHAPRRVQSALILIDGFGVEGIVRLFQDSVFMIPHLGVLSTVHQKAALEIFEKDCLVRLGTCIGFSGKLSEDNYGKKIADLTIKMPNGETLQEEPEYGTIKVIPLAEGEEAEVEANISSGFSLTPRERRKTTVTVEGGVVGLIIDARGRPVDLPSAEEDRRRKLIEWFSALDMYPKELLKRKSVRG